MQRRAFLMGAWAGAGALGFGGPALAAVPVKLKPGMRVPSFARPGLDGRQVDLAHYKGKVLLIDFWASWCAPCVIAIPHFRTLQSRLGAKGFQVVGVSMDDVAEDAKKAAARLKVNYPVVMGDAHLGARFGGILGLPVEILVGRDGRILHIWQGDTPPATIEKAVHAALG
jgi:peroxiredoxin